MNGDKMRFGLCSVLLVLIGVQAVFSRGNIEIGTRIQPMMQFKEQGSFVDLGSLRFSMDALRLQSRFSRTFETFALDAEIEFDPSEKTTEALLKDGWIQVSFRERIGLKAGFMKRASIGQHSISSKKARTISRSVMADYCREYLTPRQVGVTLFSTLWQEKIRVDLSLFDPTTEDVEGVALKDLADNPAMTLSVSPLEELSLRYGLAMPQFGSSMAGGGRVTTRAYVQSLSVTLQPREKLGLFLDASLAPDSGGVEDLVPHLDGLKEAVYKSLYIEPRFDVSVKENLKLQLTPAVELLSMYETGELSFEKSNTRFALTLAARLLYGKRFSFDAEWRNRFEKGFHSTKKSNIGVRLTYQDLFKLKLREKKSAVR